MSAGPSGGERWAAQLQILKRSRGIVTITALGPVAGNGEQALARRFDAVSARQVEAWITLADRDAARSYIGV